ncbi:LuxR family transcriptional regulator [Luteithermobacter gelatinilyticus]|uniref:LuxR family transcriptional regulator n=1 Tax=Luteithermobacter gelatinilyticus TaxID=2582913 RepID=UPI001106BB30|nr:LuxR family transcriptional regulator [Luteithermobacter gelatinilyticus]|tara:strand:- start:2172 stop:2891 length:720 start_codon:yes stop_codon:yes gene_type:complete
MMGFSDIQDFVTAAQKAAGGQELKRVMSKAVRTLGFDYFSCLSLVDFVSPPPDAIGIVHYPENWVSRYLDQRYFETDIILKKALCVPTPFYWHKLDKLNKRQQQIMDEAAQCGLKTGITVPIYVPGRLPTTFNVSGSCVDLPPNSHHALHLMAIYFQEAATRIFNKSDQDDRPGVPLTNRERECLSWVAAGKSDNDIADILSISSSTVHFHVENAKRKHGVPTRVQAVIRAVISGEIRP